MILHNFYVPSGGDVADINKNSKFAHKINFMKQTIDFLHKNNSDSRLILGDFNIAPFENDVWSHKQLKNIVSHTKIETDLFKLLMDKCLFFDPIREKYQFQEKIFSWWSYRNKIGKDLIVEEDLITY